MSAAPVSSFLAEASPSAEVRRLMETASGYDPDVWQQMAHRGLLGLHLPTRYGGQGLGWAELSSTLEETGAVLLCAPFLSTAMAVTAVVHGGDEAVRREVLPAITGGNSIATVAIAEDDGVWGDEAVRTTATPDGETWRLDGHKSYVVDGQVADLLVVAARRSDTGSVGLFLVAGTAPGLTRAPLETVDLTRKQMRLELAAVPARPLEGMPVDRLIDLAALAVAAESVGGAQRCLDMSVAHASRRVQFGQPIGTFQAVAHPCAEMLVDIECARSAVHHAARLADQRDRSGVDGGLAVAASLAKAASSEAYARAAARSIQIHGGLGFTWDCDAQLYYKRARSSALLLGDARFHRERLAGRLGW
ncbi:MAG: acyl-CoA dehydrogenase family protein [Acidimicrobiales bacterium]